MIGNHIQTLEGSATADIFSLTKKKEKEGIKIINLSIGQPDFEPPKEVLEATEEALTHGRTAYTVSRGIIELREAISKAYGEDNYIDLNPNTEILIMSGAKMALFAAITALLDSSDEILIPEPRWVSYPDMVRLVNAQIKPIPMKRDFTLNFEAIKEQISKNTKAIIINSPNNPSGHVLNKTEIKFLRDLIADYNIYIISDEIYNEFMFIDASKTLMSEIKEWKDNLIVVNGFSKTFSMTGFRLGYTLANPRITSQMLKVVQATTSCPTNFAQWGAVKAVAIRQKMRKKIKETFIDRKNVIENEINKTPGLQLTSPIEGAFYAFFNYTFTEKPSKEVVLELLNGANVSLIHGTAFGSSAEHFLRATFSRSKEEIIEAFSQIREYLENVYPEY